MIITILIICILGITFYALYTDYKLYIDYKNHERGPSEWYSNEKTIIIISLTIAYLLLIYFIK